MSTVTIATAQPVTCSVCSKTFTTKRSRCHLLQHMKRDHPLNVIELAQASTYHCAPCNFTTTSTIKYRSHCKQSQCPSNQSRVSVPEIDDGDTTTSDTDESDSTAHKTDRISCDVCKKTFVNRRSVLHRHMRTLHPSYAESQGIGNAVLYTCTPCNFSSDQFGNYRKHRSRYVCISKRSRLHTSSLADNANEVSTSGDMRLHTSPLMDNANEFMHSSTSGQCE